MMSSKKLVVGSQSPTSNIGIRTLNFPSCGRVRIATFRGTPPHAMEGNQIVPADLQTRFEREQSQYPEQTLSTGEKGKEIRKEEGEALEEKKVKKRNCLR